jgi:serine/threonine-protein kinase RsbW
MRTQIFVAKFDQLEAIREFVAQAAQDAGLEDPDVYSVELCADEACSNIIEHAYHGDEGGDIECTCDSNEDELIIIIRDHGKPFDPANVSAPDLNANLKHRQVGGLGVFLMKKLMDDVHFEQLGESGNVLTMIKRRRRAK